MDTAGINEHNCYSESVKGYRSIVVHIYICFCRMKARLLEEKHMHLEKETL